jgi:YVTN family beta-propeller protein
MPDKTNMWSALLAGMLLGLSFAAHAGPFAYIPSNGGASGMPSLTVIDTATGTASATISLGANTGPTYSVFINPAGTRVYVENSAGGAAVIDATTNTVVSQLSIQNAVLSPAGDKFFSVGYNGQQAIGVTDAATGALLATIPVGAQPGGLAFNASGTRAYVVSWLYTGLIVLAPTLQVIDTASATVIANLPLAQTSDNAGYPGTASAPVAFPFSITADPTGARVYVLNTVPGASGQPCVVSVIDAAANTLVATIPVGMTSPAQVASGVLLKMPIDAKGALLLVPNIASSSVSIIDTASNTVNGTATFAGRTISGIAWNTPWAYVTTLAPTENPQAAGELWTVDIANGYVYEAGQIGAGQGPSAPEITPAGSRLYLINTISNTVYFYSASSDGGAGFSATNVAVGVNPSVTGGNYIGPAGNDSQYTVTVTVTGGGAVFSFPAGINCSAAMPSGCSATFPALTGISLTSIPPPNISFDGWSGACSGIYSCSLTIDGAKNVTANFVVTCPFNIESGWWWNPAQGGRGYFIDSQSPLMYFGALMYDTSGRETWYVATGTIIPTGAGCVLNSALQTYSGGQTLTGAYHPPTSSSSAGTATITFADATHATASLPGETIPLQRYTYADNGTQTPRGPADPRTGIYWNPSEGGRGYGVELQNGVLYMVAWMYDAAGNPIWYVSGPEAAGIAPHNESEHFRRPIDHCCTGVGIPPPPPPPPYLGNWAQYANGQSLAGPYRSPSVVNAAAGSMTLQFFSTTSAGGTLTLPTGRQIEVDRYIQ